MTRSDITFGTLLVLGELHRPDKSALLAEGAFFFLGPPARPGRKGLVLKARWWWCVFFLFGVGPSFLVASYDVTSPVAVPPFRLPTSSPACSARPFRTSGM